MRWAVCLECNTILPVHNTLLHCIYWKSNSNCLLICLSGLLSVSTFLKLLPISNWSSIVSNRHLEEKARNLMKIMIAVKYEIMYVENEYSKNCILRKPIRNFQPFRSFFSVEKVFTSQSFINHY